MWNRRLMLGVVASFSMFFAVSSAVAQDWKAKYPALVYALAPSENASAVADRMAPMADYLTKRLGVKVTIRVANDYAAVIEGQRAGQIHIGYHGPASYARAIMTGVKIEPIVIDVYEDGSTGYYGVFYVKKDAPYQSIQDLKGKVLGLVDPNSMSGGMLPRFVLHKMNVDPEVFFSKVVYTGSHENAIIALHQGTIDVAANWLNSETDGNLRRMERKNMARYDDYRAIFKSDMLAGSPHTVLAEMPTELKLAIAQAFLDAHKDAPDAFLKARDGKALPWQRVTHQHFQPTIELMKFVDDLRKKKT